MIEVRTCKNAEEFIAAGRAIAEYGAWDLTEERADRFIQNHPVERMHAAFDDGGARSGAQARTCSTSRCRAERSRAPA